MSNNLPIDAYAALIDFCDCFISSDTGGLHIASSYKLNEHNKALKIKLQYFQFLVLHLLIFTRMTPIDKIF
ncbi:hypothetical protein DESACE_00780 [Desulfurella acetivorans A63]|nr:hypothetical protein DESACE_00780 [Desulfurella acetivorans A63]